MIYSLYHFVAGYGGPQQVDILFLGILHKYTILSIIINVIPLMWLHTINFASTYIDKYQLSINALQSSHVLSVELNLCGLHVLHNLLWYHSAWDDTDAAMESKRYAHLQKNLQCKITRYYQWKIGKLVIIL